MALRDVIAVDTAGVHDLTVRLRAVATGHDQIGHRLIAADIRDAVDLLERLTVDRDRWKRIAAVYRSREAAELDGWEP